MSDISAPSFRPAGALGRVLAVGQLPVSPREVAVVPARVALEVILMLGLGLPEGAGCADRGHDPAGPETRGIYVADDGRSRRGWRSPRRAGAAAPGLPRSSPRRGSRSRRCPSLTCPLSTVRSSAYPKVKTYARTPGSRNVISKVPGAMGPCWRTSWYIRGPSTAPSPSSLTSRPWASPGASPARSTVKRTRAPEAGGVRTRLRSRAWKRNLTDPSGAPSTADSSPTVHSPDTAQ